MEGLYFSLRLCLSNKQTKKFKTRMYALKIKKQSRWKELPNYYSPPKQEHLWRSQGRERKGPCGLDLCSPWALVPGTR